MRSLPELHEACRARGVKLTPQRLAIFGCLREQQGHPSAEELFQEVRRRHPTLTLATMCNTLQRLAEMGRCARSSWTSCGGGTRRKRSILREEHKFS